MPFQSIKVFFIRTIELSILIYPHVVSIQRYELWVSQVALEVKNSPAKQGTWVQSLVWEDPLEEGMVTHSCILTWRIPWTVLGWMSPLYSSWSCSCLPLSGDLVSKGICVVLV